MIAVFIVALATVWVIASIRGDWRREGKRIDAVQDAIWNPPAMTWEEQHTEDAVGAPIDWDAADRGGN